MLAKNTHRLPRDMFFVPGDLGSSFLTTECLRQHVENVGGSFWARVPRSSAELHKKFVHHILEDEVDGQKEEQGDQREDEEVEINGDVEAIRETHNAHEP